MKMIGWRPAVAGVVLVGLAGCAPVLKAQGPQGGVVEYTDSTASALKAAEASCQKYGRHAKVSSNTVALGTLTFDCVP